MKHAAARDLYQHTLLEAAQLVEQRKVSPLELTESVLKQIDRKSTRLNSSHSQISYAVFCLTKKNFKACNADHRDPIEVSFDAPPDTLKDVKAATVIDASGGQFPVQVASLAV